MGLVIIQLLEMLYMDPPGMARNIFQICSSRELKLKKGRWRIWKLPLRSYNHFTLLLLSIFLSTMLLLAGVINIQIGSDLELLLIKKTTRNCPLQKVTH